MAIPVGSHLSPKTKLDIITHKFVDFYVLVKDDSPLEPVLTIDEDGNPKFINQPKVKLLSFPDWCYAWNIYVAVLCDARGDPSLPKKMAKHFEIVQDLFRKGQDWRYYDTNFRKLLQSDPLHASWGSVQQELLMTARLSASVVAQGQSSKGQSFQSKVDAREIPWGFCRRHHIKGSCTQGRNCQYWHKCFNCSGPHPFVSCRNPVKKPFAKAATLRDPNNSFRSPGFARRRGSTNFRPITNSFGRGKLSQNQTAHPNRH